jgi:hypothetical protein
MKTKTRDQVEKMQQKAVRFSQDVLHDSDKAYEIAGLSVEEYAERKKITIVNPRERRHRMARRNPPSKEELLDRIDHLEAENQELNDRLDEITDLAAPDEDEDDYQD